MADFEAGLSSDKYVGLGKILVPVLLGGLHRVFRLSWQVALDSPCHTCQSVISPGAHQAAELQHRCEHR